jgi:DNA-binding beta-propeller fold protein YncE
MQLIIDRMKVATVVALAVLAIGSVKPAKAAASSELTPVTLTRITPLPEIVGDFDHFAVDLKRGHLFVSAEEHHSIEMFDVKTGEHLRSIPGVKTPHTLAFVPEMDELFVADGGDNACIVLSGADYRQVDRIPLGPGPDAALYDPESKLFYIGNGGRKAKTEMSVITAISVMNHSTAFEIPVEGNNLESMAVDHAHNRFFVNIRDKKQVGVIDLGTKQVVATWTSPEMNRNTTLTFDAATQRVFVAGRTPGKLFIFDASTGKTMATYDCVNIADGMVWDAVSRRIYITGSQGLSIFHQTSKDQYEQLTQLPTNGGKTTIYVPELKTLFIVHPKTSIDDAALLVYHVNVN